MRYGAHLHCCCHSALWPVHRTRRRLHSRHRAGAHHAVLTVTAARKVAWLLQFLRPSLRFAVTASVLQEAHCSSANGLLRSSLAQSGLVRGAYERGAQEQRNFPSGQLPAGAANDSCAAAIIAVGHCWHRSNYFTLTLTRTGTADTVQSAQPAKTFNELDAPSPERASGAGLLLQVDTAGVTPVPVAKPAAPCRP